eukprot:TRINITY_DN13409_c0_g1_i2.p2 TRINITY_DN13409_c0_g1~~TRINITY_DN13409_c0_g1_i2.p2  ORF type:complete len:148 (+),score=33.13 TRINITY_DN13409_c0_g1_i2:110-553(+)
MAGPGPSASVGFLRPGYAAQSLALRHPSAVAGSFLASQLLSAGLEPLLGLQWHTPLTFAFGASLAGYCARSEALHMDVAQSVALVSRGGSDGARLEVSRFWCRGAGAALLVSSLGLLVAQAIVDAQERRRPVFQPPPPPSAPKRAGE